MKALHHHLRSAFSALSLVTCVIGLSACASAPSGEAAADIGLLAEAGRRVDIVTTPDGYKQGDRLIAYEGPGWESDKVGFRIYLDGRNAIDVFGKKAPGLILSKIGRGGDDYHAMSLWGMDILKVGASLGAGGIGVFENGEVRQIGAAKRYKAEIIDSPANEAAVRVTHIDSESCGGDVTVDYTIEAGQRMTSVTGSAACDLPFAAGLVIHPGTEHLESDGANGGWQYIARYGSQSLVPDGLGLAIFFRTSDIESTGQDVDDDYIIFKTGAKPIYKTAAAWAQEKSGIPDIASFRIWLDETQKRLNDDAQQTRQTIRK